MTLKEWFAESEDNIQAIYDARNGRRYIYKRGQRLSKKAQNLIVEQVVDITTSVNHEFIGWSAWLYS